MKNKVILLDETKTYIGSYPTYVDAYLKIKELDPERRYYQVLYDGSVRDLYFPFSSSEEISEIEKYSHSFYEDVEDEDRCFSIIKFFCLSEEDMRELKLAKKEIDFIYFV
jgi:hypothetical protein